MNNAERKTMKSKTDDVPKKKSVKIRNLIVFFAAVGLLATVFGIVKSKGRIPTMPRIGIDEKAEKKIIDRILVTASEFKPNEREKELVEQLYELHMAETQGGDRELSREKLENLTLLFRKEARALAQENEERYLLLGDVVATRFYQTLQLAIQRMLSVKEQGSSKDKPLVDDTELMKKVHKYCGAFFMRAMESGMIATNGEMNTAQIAPLVLFRFRWRRFGRIDQEKGFENVEIRALYDFMAVFSPSTAVIKRLDSVKQLTRLDPQFDEAMARAVIMYESGQPEKALDILNESIKSGHDSTGVKEFARALKK
jgi:hypothetical protein